MGKEVEKQREELIERKVDTDRRGKVGGQNLVAGFGGLTRVKKQKQEVENEKGTKEKKIWKKTI